MSDLERFIPTPREITIAGRTLEFLPLKMGRVPAFTRAILPAMPTILAGNLTGAIAAYPDAFIDAVIVGAGVERDWVEALWPDDFIRLASAVMETNADFFARRVLPQLGAASRTLTAAIQSSLGASASDGSSNGDGDTPTSST